MTYLIWGSIIVVTLGLLLGSATLIIISLDHLLYEEKKPKALITALVGIAVMVVSIAGMCFYFDTSEDHSVRCHGETVYVEHQGEWWCEPK